MKYVLNNLKALKTRVIMTYNFSALKDDGFNDLKNRKHKSKERQMGLCQTRKFPHGEGKMKNKCWIRRLEKGTHAHSWCNIS